MKTIYITGEAGSGKTMLLRAIACLFVPKEQLIQYMDDAIDLHTEDAKKLSAFFHLDKFAAACLAAYTSDRTTRLGNKSHDFDKTGYRRFILGQKVSYRNHETDLLFFSRVQNLYFDEGKVPKQFRPTHSECLELFKKATAHKASYKNNGLSEIKLVREDSFYQYRQGNGYLCDFGEIGSVIQDNIALFGDILIRLITAHNGKTDDLAEFSGLVLIDDIAPNATIGAMMSYIKFLEDTFPNVQFVVTTSKLMLTSDYESDTNCFVRSLGIATHTFVLMNYHDGTSPSMFCCDKYTSDFHF